MSSYKHKSGALKRKLQKDKLEKGAKDRQTITKFLKCHEKEELQEVPPHDISKSTTAPVSQASCPVVQSVSDQKDVKEITQDTLASEQLIEAEETKNDGDSLTVSHESNEKCANPDLSMNTDDSNSCILDDPGTWPSVMSDKLRQEIASSYAGFSAFQTRSKSFPTDLSGKRFHESLLYMKTANNRTSIQFSREWLMWSASKNSIHCLPCSIFKSNQSKLAKEGFSPEKTPYKRLYRLLPMHEKSSEHRKHFLEWKTLQTSLKGHGVDSNLQQMINCEATRWKAILQRILDTTLFLSSRGLALQGENTKIDDVHNGNFWEYWN